MRWLAAAALIAAAAAFVTHGRTWQLPERMNPFAPLRIDEPPGWLTAFKLRRASGDAEQCRAVLATSGLQFDVLPDREVAGCELHDVVRISSLAQVKVNAPFMLSCRAALSLALWERHSLLPVSQQLLGATPRRIDHFGSFACRNVYGREGGRRSQHASADALDVAGFVFSDGRRITVARDWGERRQRCALPARRACRRVPLLRRRLRPRIQRRARRPPASRPRPVSGLPLAATGRGLPQIDMRWRTPSACMSLPRPRITTSPRSITRYWSASSSAKS